MPSKSTLPLPPIPIPQLKFHPLGPTINHSRVRWEGSGQTMVLKHSTMAFSKEGHEIDASPFGFCVYGTVIKDNLAGFDPPTTFGDAFGALVMGPGETTSRRFNCSRNIMNDMQALLPLECKVCHCTGYVGPWEKRESRLYLTYLPTDGFRPRILAQDGTELPPDFNLTGKDVKAIFTLVNYAWAPQRMLALAVVLSIQLL